MARYVSVGLAALLVSSCAHTQKSDEAQIYEAILFDQAFTAELGRPPSVMVVAELFPTDVLLQPSVAAHKSASTARGAVPTELQQHPRLVVVSDAESRSASAPELQVGQAFSRRHPGHRGFVRLSAIGFNAARTDAVVTAVLECGPLCSHGNMFRLRRTNGRWQITKRDTPWIS